MYGFTPSECMNLTLYQVGSLLEGSEASGKRVKYNTATPAAREFMKQVEGWNG